MSQPWVRAVCAAHQSIAFTGVAIDSFSSPIYLEACTQHRHGIESRLIRNVTDKAGPHFLLTIRFNHPKTDKWVPCDRLIAMDYLWCLFGLARPRVQGKLPTAEDQSWQFRLLVQNAKTWRAVTEMPKRSQEPGWLSLGAIENAMMAERLENRQTLLEVAN